MLELLILILVIFWVFGQALNVGALIHILLVIAVIVLIFRLVRGHTVV